MAEKKGESVRGMAVNRPFELKEKMEKINLYGMLETPQTRSFRKNYYSFKKSYSFTARIYFFPSSNTLYGNKGDKCNVL